MTEDQILTLPDVRAALTGWWDEARAFVTGLSSSVIADLLCDHGWPEDALLLRTLRSRGHHLYRDGGGGALYRAAGVFGPWATEAEYVRWVVGRFREQGLWPDQISGHLYAMRPHGQCVGYPHLPWPCLADSSVPDRHLIVVFAATHTVTLRIG